MRLLKGLMLALALAVSAGAEQIIVVTPGSTAPEAPGVEVIVIRSQPDLEALAARSGARPGRFPALVDLNTGSWAYVAEGDVSAARADVEEQNQESKPDDQKVLENAYFDLIDEIYATAGLAPPDAEAAKNVGAARSKIVQARAAKPGTGPAGKKTADDVMEFVDLQLRLLAMDAELKGYDPKWLRRAKRHEIPGE